MKATSKLLVKGKVVGKNGLSKVTARLAKEVPLLLLGAWPRGRRHGDPHGQVIGARPSGAGRARGRCYGPYAYRRSRRRAGSLVTTRAPGTARAAACGIVGLEEARKPAEGGAARGKVPERSWRAPQRRRRRPGPRPFADGRRGRPLRHEGPSGLAGVQNDGAGGTALVVEALHVDRTTSTAADRRVILFDGEESPRGATGDFEIHRPARQQTCGAALQGRRGDDPARLRRRPRPCAAAEANSDRALWRRLAAARRVGTAAIFPTRSSTRLPTTTCPSWGRACRPSISSTSRTPAGTRSATTSREAEVQRLDAVGETVHELLRTF